MKALVGRDWKKTHVLKKKKGSEQELALNTSA